MRPAELTRKRVYLDTNFIVYAVEGYPPLRGQLQELLLMLDDGRMRGVTSEITLAEAFLKPRRDQDPILERAYHAFLQPRDTLEILPITRPMLVETVTIRAARALKLPDAIHVATARLAGCDVFLTNDKSLRPAAPPEIVLLEDLT